jgi:hypothetical protein
MKRISFALFALASLTACSGPGTPTTDRGTEGGDDTATETETSDDPTSGGTTDSPTTTDAPTTDDETGDPSDGTTGSTGAADTGGSETGDDPTTGGDEDVTIVGTWLSEGKNVAPILVDLAGTASITATFEDVAYDVATVDMDGQEVQFTGVYTVEPSGVGNIMNITLEQSAPQTVTSEGIYEIDSSTTPPTLRYEVVQTVPDVGAQAPTAELGFGGTGLGADLTQIFIWQE